MGIVQACASSRKKSTDIEDNRLDAKFDFLNVKNLEEEE